MHQKKSCFWKTKIKLPFILLIFLGLTFRAPVWADDLSLKIEVLPDQSIVKAGTMFLVMARVINKWEGATSFWANTCSFHKHWVSDVPEVLVQPWTCRENDVEEITLETDDVYEKNMMLYIPHVEKPGPLTFRLGFKRMSENNDVAGPLWSDPITLHVLAPEGMKTAQEQGSDSLTDSPEKSSEDEKEKDEEEKKEEDISLADQTNDEDEGASKHPAEKWAVH